MPIQGQNFDKLSLFNENTWKEAGTEAKNVQAQEGFSGGHSVIKIEPNYYYYRRARNDLQAIFGVMLKNVSFSLESDWQEMGIPKFLSETALQGVFDKVTDFKRVAGSGDFGSVWMSKKLWRKSGDLRINPEFRIIDWDGTGKPLTSALMIAKYCLPGIRDNAVNTSTQQAEKFVEGGIKKAQKYADTALAWAKELGVYESVGDILKTGVDSAVSVSTNIADDLHDFVTIKDAPPPVKVQIGQYFYHPDMVVSNVDFEFSKEVSSKGPLYVDVKMQLASRKILNGLNDVGIRETKNISRVDVQEGNSTINTPFQRGIQTNLDGSVINTYTA